MSLFLVLLHLLDILENEELCHLDCVDLVEHVLQLLLQTKHIIACITKVPQLQIDLHECVLTC